jgi:hypothetical protein
MASNLLAKGHPLALTDLVVAISPDRGAGVLRVRAEAATTGPTGVEMEAMTAASVAALTVYDMVKGVERGVEIRSLRLVSKTGGKSGDWHAGMVIRQIELTQGPITQERKNRPQPFWSEDAELLCESMRSAEPGETLAIVASSAQLGPNAKGDVFTYYLKSLCTFASNSISQKWQYWESDDKKLLYLQRSE